MIDTPAKTLEPDTKKDAKSKPGSAQSPETKAGETAAEQPSKPPKKLLVEKRFDKAVYGGISYGAQAGTGIVVTNWLTHGRGVRFYDKLAKWTGKNIVSKVFPSLSVADAIEKSRAPLIIGTMIGIGNLFLIPVKLLENRKPEILRKMNEKDNQRYEAKGYVLTDEEKEAQEARLTYLENAPKQNWRSLGFGRGFAIGAVYATSFALDKNKKFNNDYLEKKFSKGVIKTTEALGFEKLAHSKRMENYSRIGFYDVFYSMISAGGLYVYSHFIEPPKEDKPTSKAAGKEDCPPCSPKEEANTETHAHKKHAVEELKTKKSNEKSDTSFANRLESAPAENALQHSL